MGNYWVFKYTQLVCHSSAKELEERKSKADLTPFLTTG